MRISSALPPTAAAGRPPPITLPRSVRSAPHPGQLLRAAARDAKAADHLVEHQQRAGRVGTLAQQLEEALARGTSPMFAGSGSAKIAASS